MLNGQTEMTDKTTPDRPDEQEHPAGHESGGAHARLEPQPKGATMADESTPSSETTTPAAAGGAKVTEASAPSSKRPLITAIEIENFKGIGAPVRIDLRPITLLFGRNSAGKSTILQALCYAHEILSHRNVDAHKTDLGGDQIDLGGFGQFVHGHDLDRTVRLRFELNLEGWRVPAPLWERVKRNEYVEPELAGEFEEWVEANGPARLARSGWVELTVASNRRGDEPLLAGYAVGINDALVGRIRRNDAFQIMLEFNWTHSLFDDLLDDERAPLHADAANVAEAPDAEAGEWHLRRVQLFSGLKSPLPDWDDLLYMDGDDLQDDYVEIDPPGSTSFPRFQALITAALAGVGVTLRNELAALRYLGPVRELRPHAAVEPDPHEQGNWSDGSAAWNRLLSQSEAEAYIDGDLLKTVNAWLAGRDRLDTGYMLRRRATFELPADVPPVSQIRRYEWLRRQYCNEQGAVDLGKRVRELAPIFVRFGHSQQGAERQARRLVRADEKVVNAVEKLEGGRPPSDVKALVRAIAEAREQSKIEIVTAESELPVRTSDIGVGVSQILPVVTAALDPKRPGITAIEQPELHVHPKMQVELGDLFVAALDPYPDAVGSMENPERDAGVFLIETHSEHLILRLLRRIEETHSGELQEGKPALKPDQVSVAFLEQTDGDVRATRLRIDEEGEFIDRWPQGFFEERDDELF